MFRVIANQHAPLSPDNVTVLDSFVDAFNPLKYPITFGNFTLEAWVNMLKVLWCRENILENFNHYFLDANLRSLEDRESIFAHIPDDKLWLLYFVRLSGDITTRNQLRYQVTRPLRCYRDGNYSSIEYSYESLLRAQYSYRSENWGTEITGVLNDIEATIVRICGPFMSGHHAGYNVPQCYNNNWMSMFISAYTTGFAIYDTNNRALTRSTVAERLAADPINMLINEGIPGGEYHIRLKQPITKNNKMALHTIFNYSTNVMNLLSWPLIAKGEHKPVLYGIELELSTDYTVKELIDATDEPFCIMKQDSSVSGSKRHPYEMVTVPMSYKAHKKQWAYWFSNLDYNRFDCTKDTTNGMHVHIGTDSFVSDKHRTDFTWFFTQPAHQDFMFTFSERTAASLQHYAPMPDHHNRSIVRAYRDNLKMVTKRRGAINYSPKGTLEVRLFRGIVSLADVLKNLEFVDSVFHFTMDERNIGSLTLPAYFHWLSQRPKNQYKILKKYFDANDRLKPLIKAAPILAAIFTEKNPDKIIEIIKKRKFAATNDHVSILNRKFKKRIFVLNKSTGQIELNQSNKSPVSFLDRLVEARILGVRRLDPQPSPPIQESEEIEEEEFFDIEPVSDDRLTIRRRSVSGYSTRPDDNF